MSYPIEILPRAQRELEDLPHEVYAKVVNAVRSLASDPRPHGSRKLTDRAAWRVRTGAYRAIYEIDDACRTVTVVQIGHHRDVYR